MPLQVWLPLSCANKNQYGVSGITMSGNPHSWVTGPFGQSAHFESNTDSVLYNNTTAFNYKHEDFSVCLWLQKNFASKTASYSYAFSVGRVDAGGYGYGIQIYSATEIKWWFGNQNWTIGNHAENTFHHYAFVKKGTNIKIYQNGELKINTTFNGTYPTYSDGNGLGIGCFHYSSNIYPLYGTIADFRIYDHAISAREVRNIADGLLLHYPLDNQYCTGKQNLYSGETARGSLSGGTRTKLANEEGYNYKYTYTGTGSNSWFFFRGSNIAKTNFTVGKTYIWSCMYRLNACSNMSMDMRHACRTNDTTTGSPSVHIIDSTLADGKWHTATNSYTMTDTAYNHADCAPLFEIVSSNMSTSGTIYSIDIDFKNIQIIEAPNYPGWVDNSLTGSTIPNAGILVGTDLTRYGSVTIDSSVINRFAYNFAQSGYFYNTSVPITLWSFTMSFWFKAADTTGNTQHFLVGTFDSWPNNGIGIYRDAGKNYWSIVFRAEGESTYKGLGGQTYSYNEWHHLAITWNGTEAKIYMNNVLKNTFTYGSSGYTLFKNLYLGNSAFNGHPDSETEQCAMSDFRLYANCLSATRIEELYKVRGTVDNGQNAHAITFVEGEYGTTNGVTSRGQMCTASKFHEDAVILLNGSSSYTPAANVENACSPNIIINLQKYDTSTTNFSGRKYRMVFDVSWSGYTTGNTWYQGAVNGSWGSYSNCFRDAANRVRTMEANIASGSSGSYHYDTEVVVGESGSYQFYMQFRTDNSDGNATFTISNFCVYECDAAIGQNSSTFNNLVEY